ncbi:restriction endonuclease [Streptomyces bathyalis]|uniref:Restriction endonuclease n=1 Tax=Streptomyces bathyalis TaxID=2710756 RepID=A0A7T1T7A0_9ACTN|nr:restriction endonuclease [Streptomyces bathyalis]QPP07638.1 restriction endonuclease [Streptomyces bathyalis]
MVHEGALLESRTLRASVAERTEVLDKVRVLSLLPDGLHVTTRMVADYFDVAERTVNRLMQRHRDELTDNGMRTLRGPELELFKRDTLSLFPGSYPQPRSNLTLFTRRAVLNVAMLLRDSEIARRIRTYLLDAEQAHRAASTALPGPSHVDDSVVHDLIAWLDRRIAQTVAEQTLPGPAVDETRVRQLAEEAVRGVLGRTIVPLLNQAIGSQRELRLQLAENEAEMVQLRRVLREHEAAGSMAALDAMNGREFKRHIAWLCRRDGCEQVTVTGGHADAGADVLGHTADGRRLVVRCRARTPSSNITCADVRGFIGMARVEYEADVALLVATAPFTRDALLMAARHEVTAVHRGLLEAWNNGAKLRVLE